MSDKVIKFMMDAMKNLNVKLTKGGKTLAFVKILRSIV